MEYPMEYLNGVPLKIIIKKLKHLDAHTFIYFELSTSPIVTCTVRCSSRIDHFTIVCFVTWPLNESEAGVDLASIEPSQLFLCKFLLTRISMRKTSLT